MLVVHLTAIEPYFSNQNFITMNSSTTKSSTNTVLLSSVLLFSILVGGFFGFKTFKLSNTNEALTEEIGNLNTTKEALNNEVAQLKSDYETLLADHEELEATFENTQYEINENEQKLADMRANKSSFTVADEVVLLRAIREQYAYVLSKLRQQTVILYDANSGLQEENALLQKRLMKMKDQSEQLASQVFELKQSGFKNNQPMAPNVSNVSTPKSKASVENFKFDIRKKGDRPTGSARRAQKISVAFDVTGKQDQPDQDQELYLVIKDVNGMNVPVDNPIKTTVGTDSGRDEEIISQQTTRVNLTKSQMAQFEIHPKKRTLKEGFYRAFVYSKSGLLGSDQFYLR